MPVVIFTMVILKFLTDYPLFIINFNEQIYTRTAASVSQLNKYPDQI